ncbi:MAG: nucleotidyltransferase family protein [Bacteroidales bacterium]|nr:nucleotidyltransferase family protein [Candidatus Latescibacterota bacterium]
MTTFDILKEKRENVLEVAHRHGVTSMRVFGSVARGEDSAESDIDLLVTTGPHVSPWFPAGLILELEQLLGRHIDIVTEPGLNPLLRDQVLTEAVAL